MMGDFERQAVSDIERLQSVLASHQGANTVKQNFYDAKSRMKDLGISIPPHMRNIDTVMGWPGTVVDVLDERLDFEGWSEDFVDDVFWSNDLDVEAPLAHVDALIYGVSYATVTTGVGDEPDVMVNFVPPTQMVGVRSRRSRVLSEAVQFIEPDDNAGESGRRAVLFRPDETVWMRADERGWRVEGVDEHRLGRVQAVQFTNRMRASKLGGRSEITPAVISYTEAALRTLVGAEVAREFYAVPQRYILGAPESFMFDEDGRPRSGWDTMLGRMLAVERDPETGELPSMGSFPAYSMSPFFEQVRHYSQLLAAETSIPPTYLGFVTDNPSSADAIRMAENRLVKRAERRQAMFGKAWTEIGRLAMMVRDGRRFQDLTDAELAMRPQWRDASTPTRAAAADEVQKMIAAGVYTPRGEYTMKRMGLSPQDKEMLRRDNAADSAGALERLRAGGLFESVDSPAQDEGVAPDTGGGEVAS